MKPVLVLEHQLPERLAYLGTWLTKNNIPFDVFNADIHKEFPSSMENYSALAVMGGAMSANDPLYTNRQSEVLILQSMYQDKPVIGHCLGGQLMARALGAKVVDSPKPEIGWQFIEYKDNQLSKEWFGSDPTDKVIHWHYESFEIPNGALLLASTNACPNQSFAIGKHLAMQFHIEIDEKKVMSWVSNSDEKWIEASTKYDTVQQKFQILNGIKPNLEKHKKTADNIYKNWLKTTDYIDLIK